MQSPLASSGSRVVGREPCPKCGSRDNLTRYDDGHAWCYGFGCGYREPATGTIEERVEPEPKEWTPITGEYAALGNRGIKAETCERWQYQVNNDLMAQIANYRDASGKLVAQKVRKSGKQFSVNGNGRDMPLYGRWLWGDKGKSITITEGEIDALSVSQVFDLRWPVVSLPNGAQSAEKAIANAYEWLCGFDAIVLMFDMDEPGRAAAEKVAAMLPVGRVRIAALPEKDANETLLKHGPGAVSRAFWEAKVWRPDGIRHATELEADFFKQQTDVGLPFPWESWSEKLIGGMRLGELVTFTSGTGMGKSTLVRELVHHVAVMHDRPVGALMLEESNEETLEGLLSIQLNRNLIVDRNAVPETEQREAFRAVAKNVYLYDHFGSTEVDNICARIRYLAKACGVQYVFLDHVSILVSGLEGDERKIIDVAMTKLRTLVSELGIWLGCVVHLRRPQGDKGHEDGAQVHLGQLRGSHAIAQLSNRVIGLQKPSDDAESTVVEAVCLKNRRGGLKGSMGLLNYDLATGRLSDCVF